ncbi:hypothetical protein [Actinomadura fibrosa]|uniref:Uncharacterized protein n=1 Tax=Actinomadura fibrosa TaxID=111802 RepID=A0ABW2XUW6_9ACTN|nr:hypothetical protein [Actinomadura fibrosa]
MFEQPPCPDGHGEECPERVCVDCGAAVLVGSPPGGLVQESSPSRRAGSQHDGSERTASTRAVA